MSHIVDTLLAVAVMVLIMFFGISIAQAQVNISEARSCKEEIIAELENSEYNPAVINECIRQAGENGYTLSVTLYRKGQAKVTYTSADVENTAITDAQAAEVVLGYQYRLTFLGENNMHYIRGFAR